MTTTMTMIDDRTLLPHVGFSVLPERERERDRDGEKANLAMEVQRNAERYATHTKQTNTLRELTPRATDTNEVASATTPNANLPQQKPHTTYIFKTLFPF